MSTPTVFFDMDGTLVDSMYYWDRAPSCVLNALGILPDDEMEEEFARLGFYRIPAYVAERFPELGPPEVPFAIRWCITTVSSCPCRHSLAFIC